MQANAAIMRQSENFYIEQLDGYTQVRDLVSARCRGTGKGVQRHFVAFDCAMTAERMLGDPLLTFRLTAKTRKRAPERTARTSRAGIHKDLRPNQNSAPGIRPRQSSSVRTVTFLASRSIAALA